MAIHGDDGDGRRGLPRFPLTETVYLVALFTKEQARSCESPLDFLTRKDESWRTGAKRLCEEWSHSGVTWQSMMVTDVDCFLTGTVQVVTILPSVRIAGNLLRSSKCSLLTCDSQRRTRRPWAWIASLRFACMRRQAKTDGGVTDGTGVDCFVATRKDGWAGDGWWMLRNYVSNGGKQRCTGMLLYEDIYWLNNIIDCRNYGKT